MEQHITLRGDSRIDLLLVDNRLYITPQPSHLTFELFIYTHIGDRRLPLERKIIDFADALASDTIYNLFPFSSYVEVPDYIGVYEIVPVEYKSGSWHPVVGYTPVATVRSKMIEEEYLVIRDGKIEVNGPLHLYISIYGEPVDHRVITETTPLTDISSWKPGLAITGVREVKLDNIKVAQVLPSVPITKEFYEKDNYMPIPYIRCTNEQVINVVKIDQPADVHAGLIQPIFFRTIHGDTITIREGLKENIAINLDRYKSAVKTFRLKIGDQVFNETARVDAGVVFPVQVGEAPNTYHILNEDYTLVTSGRIKK